MDQSVYTLAVNEIIAKVFRQVEFTNCFAIIKCANAAIFSNQIKCRLLYHNLEKDRISNIWHLMFNYLSLFLIEIFEPF